MMTLVLVLSSVTSAAFMGIHGHGSTAEHAESAYQDRAAPCESHARAEASLHKGHMESDAPSEHDILAGSSAHGHCSACVLCSATVFAMEGLNGFQGTLQVDNAPELAPFLTASLRRLDKPPKP